MSKSDDSLKLNLDVEIKAHKPSMEEIQGYVEAQHKALEAGSNLTLNDYIKESVYKGSNTVVVADLSDMKFDRPYKDGKAEVDLLDLKGVDFSGSVIKNTSFENCNLENAVFCDTDLNNAKFEKNNTLKNLDLRGADLATCQFDDSYKDYGSYGQSYSQKIDGIKFSTTSALGREYADVKGDIFRKLEKQELVKQKTQEVQDAYRHLSKTEALYVKIGVDTGNQKYDNLVTELEQAKAGGFPNPEYTKLLNQKKQEVKEAYSKTSYITNTGQEEYKKLQAELLEMKAKPPEKDYVMHKSFQNVFSSQSDTFDSAYTRGSNKAERDQPKEYVHLSREDVVGYLDRIKNEPELSLNDFAKEKFKQEGKELNSNAKYIADCSSGGNLDNTLNRLDLSGLDFSKAKMDGVSFAGSDLRACNFTGADISRSSFEGADLGLKRIEINGSTRTQGAIFDNTTARDTNFFNANLGAAHIKDSDFKRAFMPRSDGSFTKIESTDFDYANIKNGKWDHTDINKATFNFANLEGISLAGADMRRVQAQHAILNNAIMDHCKVIESDFSNALMKDVQAAKSTFKDTLLNDIKAPGINLTESELTGFTQLKGADLEKAILEHVKAEQISFENANLDKVNAKFADFTGANLEGVKARFADLDNAVLDKAKASGIDMTGAKLNDAKAQGANFTKAIMENVEGQRADLTGAILEGANLRSANLKAAILAKVNMEKAEVDAATNFAKANVKEATGDLKEFNSEGKVTNEKKSIAEHTKQSNEMDKELNNPWYKKGVAGKLVGGLATGAAKAVDKVREVGKKVSDFMEAKLGSKWGKILGAVVGVVAGVVAAGAIVAATALTGGLAPLAVVGVYAGCALAAGAIGTGVGHVVGKKIGVGTAIATGIGMQMGIPPVAALATGVVVDAGLGKMTGKNLGEHMNSAGLMAGVLVAAGTGGLGLPALLAGAGAGKAIDLAVEKLTGKTIGQLGDKALETVSAKLNEVAENCAIDPRAKEWIVEQTKCQAASKEKLQNLEQSIDNAPKIDQAQNYALQNNLAKQTEKVESLDTKMGSLDQKLEQAKKEQQAYLEKQQTTKDVDKAQTKDVQTGKTVEKEQSKDIPKSLETVPKDVQKELSNIKKDVQKSQQEKQDAPPKDTKPKGPQKPVDKGPSM